ncbi:hypothetical protein [Chthonobacter rhizosphaerae]|uniref:hypothetical protein n=1 Tax=Chthonobacter rhizosphaerae TaxID=2735553 RepID=UPI0015EF9BCE|nr:hypothetical protein [Chthonobacter rhizosphaerae]
MTAPKDPVSSDLARSPQVAVSGSSGGKPIATAIPIRVEGCTDFVAAGELREYLAARGMHMPFLQAMACVQMARAAWEAREAREAPESYPANVSGEQAGNRATGHRDS